MLLLEKAFNNYLALDPEAPEKLAAFDGKLICIEVLGVNKNIYLFVNGSRIDVMPDCDIEPDTVISGTPAALLKLGINRDAAPLLFAREIEIRGDVRLGRQFRALLTEMDIDWEEQLATIVGDVAAHHVMQVFNGLRAWGRSAAENFTDDVGEYLQEESRDVVSGAEMETFFDDVDALRNDTDRLEAKIKQYMGARV
jgi:ubiquinone biosynthesis protein UbiJ